MAGLNVKQIHQLAHQLIQQNAGGISFGSLMSQIGTIHPQTKKNTIKASLVTFNANLPTDIHKPSRGIFAPVNSTVITNGNAIPIISTPSSPSEQAFYQPFADYLRNDLNEVVTAEPLGGSGLGSKWGTPDVVGVYKHLPHQKIKFDLEIVTAEIKIDPQSSVTAFGQATAYRLFSTKSYVVMPKTITSAEQARLEALCMLFGIGLVTFDATNSTNPNFVTRVRAQRFSPDMFYVNEFADQLYKHNPPLFQKLF